MAVKEREELIVGGFQFGTPKDAAVARNEVQKVSMLESRMDYENPSQVYTIYSKAIENRVFQTPIGYTYLKSLQDYLYSTLDKEKDIRSIPLYIRYTNTVREEAKEIKPKIKPMKVKAVKDLRTVKLRTSMIINLILFIIMIAMFIITLTAKNPNIINYENALVNKYAAWEEELKVREDIVREKEKEFNLSNQ